MRKKYLSALLFGALLFASAGTFTSCKDYDDDIENLQGQIDKVVSDLASLKSTIDNLNVGVTSVTFDEKTGELKVTTDGQSPVTYTIKTIVEAPVQEIKITVDGQDLKVNGEVVGKVGDTVKVVDNELTINGEGTGIKVGKYAILENVADNKYTISLPDQDGNLQTIELLRAVATNVTITVSPTIAGQTYAIFTQTSPNLIAGATNDANLQTKGGIQWGAASKAIDWTGPKGAVQAGQLLVGQQDSIRVEVYPVNTELDTQVLKLVDASGAVAPVKISALPAATAEKTNSGSRAVNLDGEWNLYATMDATVTGDNMGSIFTESNKNKLYALSVNGTVATKYIFIVDTDAKATTIAANTHKNLKKAHMTLNGSLLYKSNGTAVTGVTSAPVTAGNDTNVADAIEKVGGKEIALNTEYTLGLVNVPGAYDYKYSFADFDVNDAALYGITLENNVIKASDKAANKNITLNVTVLGVNGVQETLANTLTIKFGQKKVDAVTLPTSELKVTPELAGNLTDNALVPFVVDLGDFFTSMSNEEATSVKNFGWTTGGDTKFIVDPLYLNNTATQWYTFEKNHATLTGSNVTYYEDKECTKAVAFADNIANVKKIKYAKLVFGNTGFNDDATTGEHVLTFTLTNDNGEVKKANAPINITIPTFDELFEKSAAWNAEGTEVTLRLNQTGKAEMMKAYKTSIITDATSTAPNLVVNFDKVSGKSVVTGDQANFDKNADVFTIAKDAIDDNGKLRTITAESTYDIAGVAGFRVKSGKYTIKLITPLEGAKIVNYVKAEAKGIEISGATQIAIDRLPFTTDVATGDDKNGIALVIDGKDYMHGAAVGQTTLTVYDYVKEAIGNWGNYQIVTNANYETEFDSKAGNQAKLSFAGDKLTITNLAVPSGDSYTTVATITVNDVTVSGKSTKTTIELPIVVKK